MRRVSVSADIEATPEAVMAELSPASLIEYEGTYDVVDVSETDGGWLLTATSFDRSLEMDLRFEERANGVAYELVDGGPFEELDARLTIHEDATGPTDGGDARRLELGTGTAGADAVRVTMTSAYSFGGWFAPVVDWLASTNRERELERALVALAVDVGAVEHEPEGETGEAGDDGR